MTTPAGSNITYRHFPYGTAINFLTFVILTVCYPDPYDPSKTVEMPVPERAIRNFLVLFHGFLEGVHFVVKHVIRPPCAAIPMHPASDEIKRLLIQCTRLFIGGAAIGTAEGVAQALIEHANEVLGEVTDPIGVVHVNTCQPHFLIRCHTQACFTAVCVLMGHNRWEHVADSGNLSVQVMFVNYQVAVMTPRDMDAFLRNALPGHEWSVTKRTGGLQLVMLPHHASRLMTLCGRCAQDTDGNLVVAQTHAVVAQMRNYMDNYSNDCARQMCLPKRFVSIEERK